MRRGPGGQHRPVKTRRPGLCVLPGVPCGPAWWEAGGRGGACGLPGKAGAPTDRGRPLRLAPRRGAQHPDLPSSQPTLCCCWGARAAPAQCHCRCAAPHPPHATHLSTEGGLATAFQRSDGSVVQPSPEAVQRCSDAVNVCSCVCCMRACVRTCECVLCVYVCVYVWCVSLCLCVRLLFVRRSPLGGPRGPGGGGQRPMGFSARCRNFFGKWTGRN